MCIRDRLQQMQNNRLDTRRTGVEKPQHLLLTVVGRGRLDAGEGSGKVVFQNTAEPVQQVQRRMHPSVFNFGQVDHSNAGPFRRVLLCDPQFLSPRLQPATNRSIIQRHVITLKHPSKDNLFI